MSLQRRITYYLVELIMDVFARVWAWSNRNPNVDGVIYCHFGRSCEITPCLKASPEVYFIQADRFEQWVGVLDECF